jgi:hypothetical protein
MELTIKLEAKDKIEAYKAVTKLDRMAGVEVLEVATMMEDKQIQTFSFDKVDVSRQTNKFLSEEFGKPILNDGEVKI